MSSSPAPSSMAVTLQILSIVFFTFIAFLCIGLPIAVIPGYVHDQLGFSAITTGLVVGVQYLATLLTRPLAGRFADSLGTKRTITYGFYGILLSGALTLVATLTQSWPLFSLIFLLAGRVLLGFAQGLIGVGTISWGIARVGSEHTARTISWNGIAAYGAIALGAPLGVVAIEYLGFNSLGIALSGLAVVGLVFMRNKASMPVIAGERLPFRSVLGRVAPFGISLTLASIGYGTLTTFITLYYLDRGWDGAAYCLSVFGIAFVIARLLFVNAINRLGGFAVAIACMTIETFGLILLWLAPNPVFTLIGAGMAGFGLSLVYPALGVEVVKRIPISSRGAGLGAYAVFFDLALAISGPVMGAIAANLGYSWIFFSSALLSIAGVLLTLILSKAKAPKTAL